MPHVPNIRIRTKRSRDGSERIYLDYYFQGRRVREFIGPASKNMMNLAKQVVAQRSLEIATGQLVERRETPRVRFSDFAEEYLEIHAAKLKAEERVRRIIKLLNSRFGDRLLSQVSRRDVEAYQTRRREEVKPATVDRELAVLKALFNKAIAWGKAESNPVHGVRFLKPSNARVRYLSDEEASRLEATLSPHLRSIVVFARSTGMRQGEILGLTWNQVDLRNGYAHLADSKSGEGREVPLNETALEILRHLPRGLRSDRVFLQPNGKPAPRSWVSHSFMRVCRKAGITDLHFHDLRHDCASRLVMRGRSLEEVRRVLGHKTLAMTARYAHLSPGHLRDVVRTLDEPKVDTAMDTSGRTTGSAK